MYWILYMCVLKAGRKEEVHQRQDGLVKKVEGEMNQTVLK